MIFQDVQSSASCRAAVAPSATSAAPVARVKATRSFVGLTLGLMMPFYVVLLMLWWATRTVLMAMGIDRDSLERISTFLIG